MTASNIPMSAVLVILTSGLLMVFLATSSNVVEYAEQCLCLFIRKHTPLNLEPPCTSTFGVNSLIRILTVTHGTTILLVIISVST